MTTRKGNLMEVRNDIKVLDATIRDGGLCNNFMFTDEFVSALYKTNVKCGVDYNVGRRVVIPTEAFKAWLLRMSDHERNI